MDENGLNWPSIRVWKPVESQGKVSEKSGNFEMDIEWQPWVKDTGTYSYFQTHWWLSESKTLTTFMLYIENTR